MLGERRGFLLLGVLTVFLLAFALSAEAGESVAIDTVVEEMEAPEMPEFQEEEGGLGVLDVIEEFFLDIEEPSLPSAGLMQMQAVGVDGIEATSSIDTYTYNYEKHVWIDADSDGNPELEYDIVYSLYFVDYNSDGIYEYRTGSYNYRYYSDADDDRVDEISRTYYWSYKFLDMDQDGKYEYYYYY